MSKHAQLPKENHQLPVMSGTFGLRAAIKGADAATRRMMIVIRSMDISMDVTGVSPPSIYAHLFRNSQMIRHLHNGMMDGIEAMADQASQYLATASKNSLQVGSITEDMQKMRRIIGTTQTLRDPTVDNSVHFAWAPVEAAYHRMHRMYDPVNPVSSAEINNATKLLHTPLTERTTETATVADEYDPGLGMLP
jgi:hypothetical protein